MMEQPKQQSVDLMERFNNLEMLLQNTQPTGNQYNDFFNIRKPILSKETYLGVIKREDMLAYELWVDAVQENLHHGLFGLALEMMVKYLSNIRTTPSIEGIFLQRLTSQEFKYHQSQDIHEYHHPVKKRRGLFSRGPPPVEER